jgi:sugar lactone lactonase YvrE
MQTETPTVTQLIDIPLGCGEGPCWSATDNVLWFVDIPAPTLFRYDPATKVLDRFTMPSAIGSFGLVPDGRLVVALKHGIHFFDPRTGKLDFLVHPEADKPDNRYNDGKIGPDGCFWVGSMDDRPGTKEPVAALYRIDIAGRCERVLTGLTISNGLAWTPDGRTMFHSDSRQRFVQTFDFDPATGALSNGRRIRLLEEQEGRPDGAACDAEGYYWSAGVSAGVLNRIAPDGTIVRRIAMPAAAPTMPCFAGPGLRTLYVTSLTTDRLGPRQAGTLMVLDVGVAGAPIARFGEPQVR